MSSIMGHIESEHPELFALEFGKIAESDFVYTLAFTNIDQSTPHFVKNVCDHKILDEFDYGSNRIRTVRVIFPLNYKFAISDFVYTLASANIDQSAPNLATIYIPIKSQMSSVIV